MNGNALDALSSKSNSTKEILRPSKNGFCTGRKKASTKKGGAK